MNFETRDAAQRAMGLVIQTFTDTDGINKTKLVANGRHYVFTERQKAEEMADALVGAYLAGQSDTQRRIRNSLGLTDWGGDVRVDG